MKVTILVDVMSTWFGQEIVPNHIGWNTVEVSAGDVTDIVIDNDGNITHIGGRHLVAPMSPNSRLGGKVYSK